MTTTEDKQAAQSAPPKKKRRVVPKEQLAILRVVRRWMSEPNNPAVCKQLADILTTHQIRCLLNQRPAIITQTIIGI